MSDITPDEMIKWLDYDIQQFKCDIEEGYCHPEKALRYTTAIRDFIQKHSDHDMVLVPRLSHFDTCFLSRIFIEHGNNGAEPFQYGRIHDWLKQMIEAAKE